MVLLIDKILKAVDSSGVTILEIQNETHLSPICIRKYLTILIYENKVSKISKDLYRLYNRENESNCKGIEQFFRSEFFKMFHNSVVLTGIEKNMLKQLGKKYNQHIIQKGISEYLKIGKYKNIKEMVGMWNKILSRIGQKGKNDGTYQEYNK